VYVLDVFLLGGKLCIGPETEVLGESGSGGHTEKGLILYVLRMV